MKKVRFKVFFSILAVSIMITTGCKKDPEVAENDMKQMTLTLQREGAGWLQKIVLAGTGTATIDWGDDSEIEKVTLFPGAIDEGKGVNVQHSYGRATGNVTVTITGSNITGLQIYCPEITTLDVSENRALTWLSCLSGRLTTLDVSKNKELIGLRCTFNPLTNLDLKNNTALAVLMIVSRTLFR